MFPTDIPGQERRRRQRATGCRTSALLRPSPYSPATRLLYLRKNGRGTDPGSLNRWRHGPSGLLAWIGARRYLDHLPLYWNEQIAACERIPLAGTTLADWIVLIGLALQPLANRLAELLRQHACLHAEKRWNASSIRAAERHRPPTSGPIVPIYMMTVRRASCSTTKSAALEPDVRAFLHR